MKHLLAVLTIAAFPAPAQAAHFADLSVIDEEIARFTGASAGQPGGASLPVDRRLRLAACRQALALGWNGTRRDSVVVQCPDAGGWRIYVPVMATTATAPAALLVARGDAVIIEAAGEGFSVSQPGEALEGGAAGAWIRVRPAGKGEPFRAQVIRPGLVAVPVR